jgi:hypothetical protein
VIVEELISKWGFEVDTKPLDSAEQKVENLKHRMLHLAEAAVEFFSVASVFEFAHATAEAGEAAAISAAQAGMTTKAYQELAYASRVMGLSEEDVAMSFMRLSRAMEAAKKGSTDQAQAFRKAGIDVRGLTSDQVFMRLADHMSHMKDKAAQVDMAMSLFGRGGARILPLLKQGSAGLRKFREEAHEMGMVLDEDAIEKSEEFQHALHRIQLAFIGIRNSVGIGLLEPLTKVGEVFLDWVQTNREWISTSLAAALGTVAGHLKVMWNILSGLWKSLNGVVQAFGGWERVLKLVMLALGVLISYQVIAGIGAIGLAVVELIAGFEGLSAMVLAVQASMLLMPLLVGAAIVALGLVVEDFVAFFQGRNSVIGTVLNYLAEKWPKTFAVLGAAISLVTMPLRAMIESFRAAIDLYDLFTGKISGSEYLQQLKQHAMNTFVPDGSLGGMIGFGKNENVAGSASSQLGFTPGATPFYKMGGANTHEQHNNVTVPMTINVGDGANAVDISKATQKGIQDGLGPIFRGAKESYSGGGGY